MSGEVVREGRGVIRVQRRWLWHDEGDVIGHDVRFLASQVECWRILPLENIMSGVVCHGNEASGWTQNTCNILLHAVI